MERERAFAVGLHRTRQEIADDAGGQAWVEAVSGRGLGDGVLKAAAIAPPLETGEQGAQEAGQCRVG